MKQNIGFTLVELMITLAIAAILLTVAVPSFRTTIETNRLATQVNELIASINMARSEAIKRGVNVTISTAAGGFQNGWCIHLGNACAGADVLKQFPAMNSMSASSGGISTIVLNSRGQKASPAGLINININPTGCTGTPNMQKTVSIANTGRASVTTGNCP